MKILERPHEKLILLLAAAAVAAGAGAGIRAQESRGRIRPARRRDRAKNSHDKMATNCFTHGGKLVNGMAA